MPNMAPFSTSFRDRYTRPYSTVSRPIAGSDLQMQMEVEEGPRRTMLVPPERRFQREREDRDREREREDRPGPDLDLDLRFDKEYLPYRRPSPSPAFAFPDERSARPMSTSRGREDERDHSERGQAHGFPSLAMPRAIPLPRSMPMSMPMAMATLGRAPSFQFDRREAPAASTSTASAGAALPPSLPHLASMLKRTRSETEDREASDRNADADRLKFRRREATMSMASVVAPQARPRPQPQPQNQNQTHLRAQRSPPTQRLSHSNIRQNQTQSRLRHAADARSPLQSPLQVQMSGQDHAPARHRDAGLFYAGPNEGQLSRERLVAQRETHMSSRWPVHAQAQAQAQDERGRSRREMEPAQQHHLHLHRTRQQIEDVRPPMLREREREREREWRGSRPLASGRGRSPSSSESRSNAAPAFASRPTVRQSQSPSEMYRSRSDPDDRPRLSQSSMASVPSLVSNLVASASNVQANSPDTIAEGLRHGPSGVESSHGNGNVNSSIIDAPSSFMNRSSTDHSPSKSEAITKLLLVSKKEYLQTDKIVRTRTGTIDWVQSFLNLGFESKSLYSLVCPLRKGRWKAEEEKYTMELLRLIDNGTIRLPHGQSIRGFIAKKLHSDDMRVLKKLSNCKMFGFARSITPCISSEGEIDVHAPGAPANLQRLEKLKSEFLRSVQLEALVAVRKYLNDSAIRELLNSCDA